MSKQYGGGFSTNGSGAGSAGDQYGFDPIRGAPLSAAFKVRSKRAYRQRGAGLGDGTGAGAGVGAGDPSGFDAIHAGSSVSGIVLSDAAAYKIIPQGVTEQGMSFQKMTSSFHRSRKARKQRGGALTPAPYDSLGEVLPSSMTGPMTTTGSGGSATGVLDSMLVQTNGLVRQHGGGSRRKHRKTKGKKQSRKQQQRNRQNQQRNRNRQNQQRNRNRQNQQRTRRRQRGGALGFGPATGPSVILSPQELTKAGLNPQWFNENQVNPNFGGALTVPGGR